MPHAPRHWKMALKRLAVKAEVFDIPEPWLSAHVPDGADRSVWHQRLVLFQVEGGHWAPLDPELLVQILGLNMSEYALLDRDSDLPEDVFDETICFEAPPRSEVSRARRSARAFLAPPCGGESSGGALRLAQTQETGHMTWEQMSGIAFGTCFQFDTSPGHRTLRGAFRIAHEIDQVSASSLSHLELLVRRLIEIETRVSRFNEAIYFTGRSVVLESLGDSSGAKRFYRWFAGRDEARALFVTSNHPQLEGRPPRRRNRNRGKGDGEQGRGQGAPAADR